MEISPAPNTVKFPTQLVTLLRSGFIRLSVSQDARPYSGRCVEPVTYYVRTTLFVCWVFPLFSWETNVH